MFPGALPGAVQHFMQSSQFYWLSPPNDSAKDSTWQTIKRTTCNLVDYLHIHIDYHMFTSLLIIRYHSMVADTKLCYWLLPIKRNTIAQFLQFVNRTNSGATTQWAIYICNWNKQPPTNLFKINSESWLVHITAALAGPSHDAIVNGVFTFLISLTDQDVKSNS